MAGGRNKPPLIAGMGPQAYASPAPPRSQHDEHDPMSRECYGCADSGGARGQHRLAVPSPRLGGVFLVRRPFQRRPLAQRISLLLALLACPHAPLCVPWCLSALSNSGGLAPGFGARLPFGPVALLRQQRWLCCASRGRGHATACAPYCLAAPHY